MDPRRLLRETTVAGAGIRDLVSITGDATIREAIGLMKAEKVGCVVVVDSERVQGVFTERDLVVSVLGKGVPLDGASYPGGHRPGLCGSGIWIAFRARSIRHYLARTLRHPG